MVAKIFIRLKMFYYKILNVVYPSKFKKTYPTFLRRLGIKIPLDYFENGIGFIHPTAYFDSTNYSLISVGKNTTISMNVIVLTHDYSIVKGLQALGYPPRGKFVKSVVIGSNCFVGANTFILPGSNIGDNVIIGAASVVRGNIPSDSIVVGNPAVVVGNTKEWAMRHIEKNDFFRDW